MWCPLFSVKLQKKCCSITSYRGHHWKGNQNNILKKKKWRRQQSCKTCYIYKIKIALIFLKKWHVTGVCITLCYQTIYNFGVSLSIAFELKRKHACSNEMNKILFLAKWVFCWNLENPRFLESLVSSSSNFQLFFVETFILQRNILVF